MIYGDFGDAVYGLGFVTLCDVWEYWTSLMAFVCMTPPKSCIIMTYDFLVAKLSAHLWSHSAPWKKLIAPLSNSSAVGPSDHSDEPPWIPLWNVGLSERLAMQMVRSQWSSHPICWVLSPLYLPILDIYIYIFFMATYMYIINIEPGKPAAEVSQT